MVVERNMDERIVGQTQDDVADVVWGVFGQLGKHGLHPPLVLVCVLTRPHRIPGDKPLLHASPSRSEFAPSIAAAHPTTYRRTQPRRARRASVIYRVSHPEVSPEALTVDS